MWIVFTNQLLHSLSSRATMILVFSITVNSPPFSVTVISKTRRMNHSISAFLRIQRTTPSKHSLSGEENLKKKKKRILVSVFVYSGCLGFFSCCWNRTFRQNISREKGFIGAHVPGPVHHGRGGKAAGSHYV